MIDRSDDDRLVTVCAACLTAACWRGLFRCDESVTADTTRKRVADLRALGYEHSDYYRRDDDNYPEPTR